MIRKWNIQVGRAWASLIGGDGIYLLDAGIKGKGLITFGLRRWRINVVTRIWR